ncbi:MAG TPA: hypothetical protein VHN98_00210 [Acidimicrobiales bacterium]|nr:hypothetical protein [Acidimicrobiales bacterium]
MNPLARGAALAVAVLAFAACGSSALGSGTSTTGDRSSPSTTAFAAPCSLLTTTEASELRGATLEPVEVKSTYGPDTAVGHACDYRLPAGREDATEASIRYYRNPVDPQDFDLDWRLAHEPDKVPAPHAAALYDPADIVKVPSVGLDAILRVDGPSVSLDTRTADGMLRVTVDNVPRDVAQRRLVEAAQRALARLHASP